MVKVYGILDEIILGGEIMETSKAMVMGYTLIYFIKNEFFSCSKTN